MPTRAAERRRLTLLALVLAAGLVAPFHAAAHPLGNFSIIHYTHYTALRLQPGAVDVRYLVDMAEIPIVQEIQDTGITTVLGLAIGRAGADDGWHHSRGV